MKSDNLPSSKLSDWIQEVWRETRFPRATEDSSPKAHQIGEAESFLRFLSGGS
ncbi:hypothetical protein [Endozoicomonas sp. GU-1]|uniref:hypothetical protein n=1 Tax=Endozoicomonas sp. GU-1 TaxID=3009078 RepID=UPI0022B32FC0|nr:hypothetical protein [Endozoicomonas sp. GU-1]WBA83709.1 hypothetical protein O2T12_11630 [Endozoicomonas sp. GU-1]